MKISINQELLLEKLTYASKFTSSKLSSITALTGVFIKGEKKLVHFYSTNLNSYYHTTVKLKLNNKFEAIIEPKKTIEFLSFLSPGKIDWEIEEKLIVISQGRTRGEFPIIAAEEFPLPPKIEGKPQKIKEKFFLDNLPLVLFAASTDESRPVLTGVNFITQDDEINIVSTDGFRLSLLRLKKEINIPSMIVPSSFLTEAAHFIKEEEEILLNYSPQEKLISFCIGSHELYSRLIEGEYPPFEKVIPTEKKTTIELDREEFLRNIKLIAIFARELSNIIIIQTTKDGVIIRPKAEKEGQDMTFQEATIEGEEQKIAFNYKFLLDFANHLDSKKIIIDLVRPDSPVAFKSDKNPNFLHIIMPVRIQE